MIIAHHELLMVVQGGAGVGLAGWAAAIGARWYAIRHRHPIRSQPTPTSATAHVASDVADRHDHHEGDRSR